MSSNKSLKTRIREVKEERNAVILAHNYQPLEIQEIADYAGDSLELSRKAAGADADVIVFCGVHFMAEVAAILAPEKLVVLPHPGAGCPLADNITAASLRRMKDKYPQAAVACYINSSAEVKAESHVCVTSSNAVAVVASLDENEIIFVPDQNLADYVARQTGKTIIPWSGYCPSHHVATSDDVSTARETYPGAALVVHPECRPEVVQKADRVLSTGKILNFSRHSGYSHIIVGTETGIIPRLQVENPEKEFYALSKEMICPDMKLIDLEKLLKALETLEPRVTVPESIAAPARQSLDRMLAVV